jgi:hypothetical protein
MYCIKKNIPFDGESSHTGLFGEHIAAHALNNRLGRGVCGELLRVVLVVNIVTHSHKLSAVVAAGEQDHRHTENLGLGNALQVRGIGLEYKLVHADGDGADQ